MINPSPSAYDPTRFDNVDEIDFSNVDVAGDYDVEAEITAAHYLVNKVAPIEWLEEWVGNANFVVVEIEGDDDRIRLEAAITMVEEAIAQRQAPTQPKWSLENWYAESAGGSVLADYAAGVVTTIRIDDQGNRSVTLPAGR